MEGAGVCPGVTRGEARASMGLFCLAQCAQLRLLLEYGGRCRDGPREEFLEEGGWGLGEPRGTNSNSEGKAG